MASQSIALRRAPSVRVPGAIMALSVALLLAGRAVGLADAVQMQTFTIIFTAIVVEALPFIMLGAFVSGIVAVYVSDKAFARVARLPVPLQVPLAAVGGFAFPVCECGSIPVARRLIARGIHPSAGLSFMVASPIFNPIVLAATWAAYAPRGLGPQMVAGRAGLGLILAGAAGWALGSDGGDGFFDRVKAQAGGGSCCSDASCTTGSSRPRALADHVAAEFFALGKFLVAGAALAAAIQALIPQSLVSGFARTPLMGSLVLMLIAFISSLCSQSDAFVAVSFSQFPVGSQLSFLVLGPTLDAKLAFLYGASFRKRFVVLFAALVIPLVLAGALVFEVAMRWGQT